MVMRMTSTSTALLATDKRVFMAPAMNVRMWNHAATQRNLKRLEPDGVIFVGPGDGEIACAENSGRAAWPSRTRLGLRLKWHWRNRAH